MQCTKQTGKHKSVGSASGLKQYEVITVQMQTFQFHSIDNVVTLHVHKDLLILHRKVMKKIHFLEYNYSVILSCLDLTACVKELGGLESTPQTNFIEKSGPIPQFHRKSSANP